MSFFWSGDFTPSTWTMSTRKRSFRAVSATGVFSFLLTILSLKVLIWLLPKTTYVSRGIFSDFWQWWCYWYQLLQEVLDRQATNCPCKESHLPKGIPIFALSRRSKICIFPQVGSLLSCPSCDYTCHKSTRLTNHMNAVHLGVKPFHCDQCPSAFPNRFPILLHVSCSWSSHAP